MKKLFTVQVETEMVVLASDKTEAERTAQEAMRWDYSDHGLDYFANDFVAFSGAWDEKTLPWGDHEGKTIGEWIEAGAGEAYRARMARWEKERAQIQRLTPAIPEGGKDS